MAGARTRNEVRDDIVDQHSLLLFIKYSAERPKMTSNGTEILNTRLALLIPNENVPVTAATVSLLFFLRDALSDILGLF